MMGSNTFAIPLCPICGVPHASRNCSAHRHSGRIVPHHGPTAAKQPKIEVQLPSMRMERGALLKLIVSELQDDERRRDHFMIVNRDNLLEQAVTRMRDIEQNKQRRGGPMRRYAAAGGLLA